jgi:hypothetical protein
MKKSKTVKFLGEECSIEVAKYGNGRTAILLQCQNGEPMATATINLPDESLKKGEAFIKDYSENEGMLEALREAGIVTEVLGYVSSGFVRIPKCKITL